MKQSQILGVNRWEVGTNPTEFTHDGMDCSIRLVRYYEPTSRAWSQDFEITVCVNHTQKLTFRLATAIKQWLDESARRAFQLPYDEAQRHRAWQPYGREFSLQVGELITRYVGACTEAQP